jgi:hypothetical protein
MLIHSDGMQSGSVQLTMPRQDFSPPTWSISGSTSYSKKARSVIVRNTPLFSTRHFLRIPDFLPTTTHQ